MRSFPSNDYSVLIFFRDDVIEFSSLVLWRVARSGLCIKIRMNWPGNFSKILIIES